MINKTKIGRYINEHKRSNKETIYSKRYVSYDNDSLAQFMSNVEGTLYMELFDVASVKYYKSIKEALDNMKDYIPDTLIVPENMEVPKDTKGLKVYVAPMDGDNYMILKNSSDVVTELLCYTYEPYEYSDLFCYKTYGILINNIKGLSKVKVST